MTNTKALALIACIGNCADCRFKVGRGCSFEGSLDPEIITESRARADVWENMDLTTEQDVRYELLGGRDI